MCRREVKRRPKILSSRESAQYKRQNSVENFFRFLLDFFLSLRSLLLQPEFSDYPLDFCKICAMIVIESNRPVTTGGADLAIKLGVNRG